MGTDQVIQAIPLEITRWLYAGFTITWKHRYVSQKVFGFVYEDRAFPITYHREEERGKWHGYWTVYFNKVTWDDREPFDDDIYQAYRLLFSSHQEKFQTLPDARRYALELLIDINWPGALLTLEAMKL